ncbi:MAG: hypothetical protein LQ342_006301 [Letrouitia transgressa]|nr:MAG: hypothetical protein LQ342_006301 [Letrouitia transgressa]
MTELSFAKSFLSTLDSRPIKLPADHVADPRTFQIKGAVTPPHSPYSLPPLSPTADSPTQYTLPRYSFSPPMRPPSQKPSSSTTSSPTTTSVLLKSLRNPPLSLSLPAKPLDTSIHALKTLVKEELGRASEEGIKILYNKKPCPDVKTIAEVVGDEGRGKDGGVEFQVMVVGGGGGGGGGTATVKPEEGGDTVMKEAPAEERGEVPVAQGVSGEEVLRQDAFWQDLRAWLVQRVRDEGVAGDAWGVFKGAWHGRQ